MKQILLAVITSVATILAAAAQPGDTWKIYLGKKLLLQSPVESASPTIMLDKKLVNGKNILTIQYKAAESGNDMKRSFSINDENESTIQSTSLKGNSGTAVFSLKGLKKATGKNLSLFTVAIPKDPSLAAAVRVRRFILCRIEWK